jgi:hypothetical protein
MLNAIWLVPIVLWLAHGYADPEASPLDAFYFGLTALFWIGHRLCSTWLAYCTEAYRPLLRKEPVRFVVLPLLVTAACFAVFLPADEALPWTRWDRFVGMAILDYAFVTYHFATQHFGALSLYRTRAERARCARTRRLDRIFALGVGGVLVFVADVLAGSAAYQGLWIDNWLIPAWLDANQATIRAAALLVLFVATASMLIAEARAAHCRVCSTSWDSPPWLPSRFGPGACFSSLSSGRHSTGSSQQVSLPKRLAESQLRQAAPCDASFTH